MLSEANVSNFITDENKPFENFKDQVATEEDF